MKKNAQSIDLIFVVSDLHCGGSTGLMPPEFVTHTGNVVVANAFQKYLWQLWTDMEGWITEKANGRPYALVLNGDLIEGLHHRNKEIVSSEVVDHMDIARECIEKIFRPTKTYVVKGTECHVNGYEEAIGRQLNPVRNPETNRVSFDRLDLNVNGCNMVFRHHINTTSRKWTEAGAYSVHLTDERAVAATHGLPVPQVVTCSHRHKFGHWLDGNGMLTVCPPWQVATRYAHKVVSNPVVQPGIISYDFGGKEKGDLPHFDYLLYQPIKQNRMKL